MIGNNVSATMFPSLARPLRTFARKFSNIDFFLRILQKCKKKWGVTDFVLEITYREEHPKSEKLGFLPNKATVAGSPKILQLHL